MPPALQFLVLTFAGWVNRHQDDLIAYLREETRVLREQPVPWWRPSVEVEWILLSSVVQEWIRIGDVRPVMARGPTQGRQVEFGSSAGGTRLFGTLACQLLFTITRVTGVAVCSACAAIYIPTRRPRPDQRRYCQSCRDGGVPQRDAQRDRQRRRRAALPSTDRT